MTQCEESVVVHHSRSVHVVVDLCVCVYLYLLKCISTPIFTRHTKWDPEPLGSVWHRRGFLSPPPADLPRSSSTPPSISLWDFNLAKPAARGLLMHSLSWQNVHTLTHRPLVCDCVCVWGCGRDSVKNSWRIFVFISIFLALLCTAWTIWVIVTKSSRKDFMELTIILLSRSLVFQMQKECFSLPAIKATITLFLYTNGKKKYMYMNLYTNIFMQMWSGWINTTTSHHPKSMDHSEKPVDSRELWDLQFDTRKGQGRGSPNGRDYKHACANHLLDTFQATVFTPIFTLEPL